MKPVTVDTPNDSETLWIHLATIILAVTIKAGGWTLCQWEQVCSWSFLYWTVISFYYFPITSTCPSDGSGLLTEAPDGSSIIELLHNFQSQKCGL